MKPEAKTFSGPLTLKRKRIMIYFIEATEKLLRSEGIGNLSIRKIATEAGYNSATIYNYFDNLEQLTMFGSVCYLREYVSHLEKELRPDMRAIDQYRTIYRCFNQHALRYPEIYHNLFSERTAICWGTSSASTIRNCSPASWSTSASRCGIC